LLCDEKRARKIAEILKINLSGTPELILQLYNKNMISKEKAKQSILDLEKFGIVKPTRKFGKTKLYKLNDINRIVKLLIAVDWALAEKSFEEVKQKVPLQITKHF